MKEIIKFSGNKDDLVWIYPKANISKDAEVIVDKDYQAILVRNGKIIPYFPGVNKAFSEKVSLFNKYINDCTIYFFNKSKDVKFHKWGTKYPIRYFDKHYQTELSMRAHGKYKVYLDNPRLFMNSFKLDSNVRIENDIKAMVIIKITEKLAKLLNLGKYNALSINAYLNEISTMIQDELNQDFEEWGFSLFNLSFTELSPLEVNEIKNECPNCQAKVNPQMKFCSNCGMSLVEVGDVDVV